MRLAILGTVGVPGRYGGFETLAENLVQYCEAHAEPGDAVTVYCSARAYPDKPAGFHGARLRYSRFDANGAQSIVYDALTALDAALRGHDRLLILGVSGTIVLPVLRLFPRTKIVVNVDGIEWQRSKWQGMSRRFLRWSEALAVRFAHQVIADNQGIADYLRETYGCEAEVIAYGGDHALTGSGGEPSLLPAGLPADYALALCRIEPENNVEMILEAFDGASRPLVFVGNWTKSAYGRDLQARFSGADGLHLLDPVYEPGALLALRKGAAAYVHGHSAGGTNPSLVEMMQFGVPVFAFDCAFNRYTTEDRAVYFASAADLRSSLEDRADADGTAMREIAARRYRWEIVGDQYLSLLRRDT